MRPDYTLTSSTADTLNSANYLWNETKNSWKSGDYGSALMGGALYLANSIGTLPLSLASDMIITGSWNTGVNYANGWREALNGGSGIKLLGSSSELLLLSSVGKAMTPTPKTTTAYRQGTFADEAAGWEGNNVKGNQWASDNPLTTKDYAQKYGLPSENTGKPDWVVKGKIENFETRPAPASHNNPANTGGGKEILPEEPWKVFLEWFHMP